LLVHSGHILYRTFRSHGLHIGIYSPCRRCIMPWKETSVMDERMKFIGRLLSGEKMAPLCREFGISRVTGYKIWKRYQENGVVAIQNRSRAPHSHPNRTPFEVEQAIVRLKKEKPRWGAPKIREILKKRYPDIKPPAASTVHCILDNHGLVKKKKRRKKFTSIAGYLSTPGHPNDLWCTDLYIYLKTNVKKKQINQLHFLLIQILYRPIDSTGTLFPA